MRVAIIGAGGTGGLYGALLARAGHDVQLLARGEHLRRIQTDGLEVRSAQFGNFTVKPPATDAPTSLNPSDFVLLAVKTYDLEGGVAAAAAALAPAGVVLTLQNGVDAPDQVAAGVGAERVLIGTTSLETTIAEPGVIAHLSPVHKVTLAEYQGPPTQRVEQLAETLRSAGINAAVVPDGARSLWEKASFLVPLAALTAVTDATLGEILALPETSALMDQAFHEVAAMALASGHDIRESSARTRAAMATLQPTMRASMARDFERGRPTELEALLGNLVRRAERLDVSVPALRTCYAILKLRSLRSPKRSSVSTAP